MSSRAVIMAGRCWITDPLGHRQCERDGTASRHPVLLAREDDGSITVHAVTVAQAATLQAALGPEVATVSRMTFPPDAWYCDRCNHDVPITDGRGIPVSVPVIDGNALCPACFRRLGVAAAEWGGCCPCQACQAGHHTGRT
jgi:hypothetical protein